MPVRRLAATASSARRFRAVTTGATWRFLAGGLCTSRPSVRGREIGMGDWEEDMPRRVCLAQKPGHHYCTHSYVIFFYHRCYTNNYMQIHTHTHIYIHTQITIRGGSGPTFRLFGPAVTGRAMRCSGQLLADSRRMGAGFGAQD